MAMVFLTTDDFTPQIRTMILNLVADDSSILDKAEATALEEMKSYLSGRYDTAHTFTQTGTSRNPLILTYCVDIVLYHIHARIPGRDIPTIRLTRYGDAIAWLRDVAAGTVNPSLNIRTDVDGNSVTPLKTGSNDKQSHYW